MQAHTKGTVHATPAEEKAEQEDKRKHGWWPCMSYKCSGKTLNPKVAEKCEACGALKRITGSRSTRPCPPTNIAGTPRFVVGDDASHS